MASAPEQPSEPPQRQGISFSALSAAFARAMGRRKKAAQPSDEGHSNEGTPTAEATAVAQNAAATSAPAPPSGETEPLEPELTDDKDPCQLCPRSILEAMLFVGNQSNEPLTSAQAAELMRGVTPEEIPDLVDELNHRYMASGAPYQIVSQGAGYRLLLRPAFHSLRDKFYGRVREARLSQAAIDILAIVAYRQPVTADDISKVRGLPSSGILSQLVRRQLLRIERPKGRKQPPQYYTTNRFLDLFGLESLEDLPQAEDVDVR
jgi:segregation and condensation protein B